MEHRPSAHRTLLEEGRRYRGARAPSDALVVYQGNQPAASTTVVSKLGQIDLFVHDSLHTERNVRFEMTQAWAILRPGSALIVDDIDANGGFRYFAQSHSEYQGLVCEAEPLHPDLRRFNNKGLFGIMLKQPSGVLTAV